MFLCRIMILRRKKLGSAEDLNFTSRIKNAESNYFPRSTYWNSESNYFLRFYMRQVNWEEKSVRLPILNSFKAVKTKFIERKSSSTMCTCIELWFLGEKNWAQSEHFFYLPHIEMRKVKRNSPITHWLRQKSKNWILTL